MKENLNVKPKGLSENTKTKPEINPEALKDRLLLESLLIVGADEFAIQSNELKRRRENEEIEFRNGTRVTIKQIQNWVTALKNECEPLFPNENPFFKEMFRLLGWKDKDPNEFGKPPIVGSYVNELIYHRFPKDVLPALRIMAMPGGIRTAKFYWYLNQEGQKKVEELRDIAIEKMKGFGDGKWNEFRLANGLPVQASLNL